MAEELTFYVDSGAGQSVSMNMEEVTWMANYGVSSFTPAVLRVLTDLFAGSDSNPQTIPNLIIYFGKFTETVTFTVSLDNDVDFKDFRKFATQTAYVDTSSTNKLQFYWGGTGDPFYTGQNNVANMTNYSGYFQSISITRRWPETRWRGTVKFLIGEVIQL